MDRGQELREVLWAVARAGGTMTYGELGTGLGVELADLGPLLRELATAEAAAGRGLLSALVVRGDTGLPGTGFFDMAAGLGRDTSDRRGCWEREVARVRAGAPPAH